VNQESQIIDASKDSEPVNQESQIIDASKDSEPVNQESQIIDASKDSEPVNQLSQGIDLRPIIPLKPVHVFNNEMLPKYHDGSSSVRKFNTD